MTKKSNPNKKKRNAKRQKRLKPVQRNNDSLHVNPPTYSNKFDLGVLRTDPHQAWKDSITFRRVGDNNTMYLFHLQKDYVRTTFPTPFDNFLNSAIPESQVFRANTNILCPLLSVRKTPQDGSPMIKHDGSPILCLFLIRPSNIQHEQ